MALLGGLAAQANKTAVVRFDKAVADIRKGLEKETSSKLREVGERVRDEVRTSHEPPFATGALRESFKTSVRRKLEVSIYSLKPQAPVWEWGGSIAPKGSTITFPRTTFVTKTVFENADRIDDELADVFDELAHRNGFV